MTVAAICKVCDHPKHSEQCTEPINGNYALRCQCAESDTSRNARPDDTQPDTVWPEST